MGDILGSAITLLAIITRPVWMMNAIRGMRASLRDAQDKLIVYHAFLKARFSRLFLYVSVLVTVVECFWNMAVSHAVAETQVLGPVMSWHAMYWHVLIWGQLVFAAWNEVLGHLEPVYLYDEDGNVRTDADGNRLCNYMHHPFVRRIVGKHVLTATKLSAPGLWLALVALTFLVQGWDIELHNISQPYNTAQAFIALGFVSKLVTGFIAVVVGAIVSLLIRKLTRLLEAATTIAAKVSIGGAMPGITIPDALKEFGGRVDFYDEDFVGAFAEFLATAPVIHLYLFDVAIFLAPHWLVARLVLPAIIIVGLFTWLFARRSDTTRREAAENLEMSSRVLFKLSLSIALFGGGIGLFFSQVDDGKAIVIMVGNMWYGVVGHAYRMWYTYLFWGSAGAVASYGLFRTYKWVSSRTEKHDSNWRSTPLSWMDKGVLVAMCLAVVFTFCSLFATGASAMGSKRIGITPEQVSGAVGLVPNANLKDPYIGCGKNQQGGVVGCDKLVIDFWTVKPAVGAIVFENPQDAIKAQLSPDTPITTVDGSFHRHHTVALDIPPGFSGKIRIVMRNVGKSKPSDPHEYGKVETFGPYSIGGEGVVLNGVGGSASRSGSSTAGAASSSGGKSSARASSAQPVDDLPPLKIDPEFQELYGR